MSEAKVVLQYDKIYNNLTEANTHAQKDGVMLGRFILIQYSDIPITHDERITIWKMKATDNKTENQQTYYNNLHLDFSNTTNITMDYDRALCQKQWDGTQISYVPITFFAINISEKAVSDSAEAAKNSAAEATAQANAATASAIAAQNSAMAATTQANAAAASATAALGAKEDLDIYYEDTIVPALDEATNERIAEIQGTLLTWQTY